MTGSRWIRRVLWTAAGVLAVVAILAAILALRFQPMARNYFLQTLRQHYKSDVTLGTFNISMFPQVRATGDNLVFRLKERPDGPDAPPLAAVRRFTFDADFAGFFRTPRVTFEDSRSRVWNFISSPVRQAESNSRRRRLAPAPASAIDPGRSGGERRAAGNAAVRSAQTAAPSSTSANSLCMMSGRIAR